MTRDRILMLMIGIVLIISGFRSRQFYPSAWGTGDRSRTIPKWLGRSWFAIVGLWFVYMGIRGELPLIVEKITAVGMGMAILVTGVANARTKARLARGSNGGGFGLPILQWFWPVAVGVFVIIIGLTLR
jgi:hypothetical protein